MQVTEVKERKLYFHRLSFRLLTQNFLPERVEFQSIHEMEWERKSNYSYCSREKERNGSVIVFCPLSQTIQSQSSRSASILTSCRHHNILFHRLTYVCTYIIFWLFHWKSSKFNRPNELRLNIGQKVTLTMHAHWLVVNTYAMHTYYMHKVSPSCNKNVTKMTTIFCIKAVQKIIKWVIDFTTYVGYYFILK